MARKPRIHCSGGVYHVILRGNGGQNIFFNKQDRIYFYLLLQEGISRFGHRIHAFCLMNNHVHLVIQVSQIPLSKIIQNLSFRYTRWINYQQKQFGHLFQGRFKSILIDKDTYLLQLIRYIHLNPVRAGLVDLPENYEYTSHNVYLGREEVIWLTSEWALSQFSSKQDVARKLYSQFVSEGINQGCQGGFYGSKNDCRILGNDNFIEKTLSEQSELSVQKPSLNEIVEKVCREYNLKEEDLQIRNQNRKESECRATICWLALQFKSSSLEEVGRRFNRDGSTLSIAVRRLGERAQRTEGLRKRFEKLKRSCQCQDVKA